MSNIPCPTLPGLGYSVIKTPNFKTRIQRAISGRVLRTSDWINPIWNFTLTYEWLDDGGLWGAPSAVAVTYQITQPVGPGYLMYYARAADVAYWVNTGSSVVQGSALPPTTGGRSLYTIVQPAGPSYIGALTGADVAFWRAAGAVVTPYAGQPPAAAPMGPVTDLRTLMSFFTARMGSFDDFLLWDPTDNDITGATLIRDPADATGTRFQLARQLAPGGLSEWITAPNVVRAIYLNGQPAMGYTVDPNTGIITFSAPIRSQIVTADFSYYFRVYFPDTLDFDNFAERFWRLKQVKLTSVALSTAPSLCFLSGSSAPPPHGAPAPPPPPPPPPPLPPGVPPPPPPQPPGPPPVTSTITIEPSAPVISSTTPLGAGVATIFVTNSDGSPFAGRVFFVAPHFDAGGVFALAGNAIIVNPAGPGVGDITGTVIDYITLDATP